MSGEADSARVPTVKGKDERGQSICVLPVRSRRSVSVRKKKVCFTARLLCVCSKPGIRHSLCISKLITEVRQTCGDMRKLEVDSSMALYKLNRHTGVLMHRHMQVHMYMHKAHAGIHVYIYSHAYACMYIYIYMHTHMDA